MVYSDEQERAWKWQKYDEEMTDDKPHTCGFCKWMRYLYDEAGDFKRMCTWSFANNPRGRMRKLPKAFTCDNYKKYVSYVRWQ